MTIEYIRKTAESLLEKFNEPSMQIGVTHNGKVTFLEAIGYRDLECKREADGLTQYAIGSVTKSFAAMAIAMLVDRGLVSWDNPVKKILPEFEMFDEHLTHQITLRDMASHRTGLPRHDFMWFLNDKPAEEIVKIMRYLQPVEKLRYKMLYQNHMYVLLGLVIEKLSGKKWQDFVQENILLPLGMTQTSFSITELCKSSNFALPYAGLKNAQRIPFKNIDYIGAAAAMNSNAEDMLKWLEFNLGDGRWKGTCLISPERMAECHSPQMIIHKKSPWKMPHVEFESYGLGWYLEAYRGEKVVHHNGNVDGFSSLISFIPKRDIAFVIHCNKSYAISPMIMQYILYDLFLGFELIDWDQKVSAYIDQVVNGLEKSAADLQNGGPKNSPPTLKLEAYAGQYNHPAYGSIGIEAGENSLWFHYGDLKKDLEHICFDTFFLNLPVELFQSPVRFRLNEQGDVEGLEIQAEPMLKQFISFSRMNGKQQR